MKTILALLIAIATSAQASLIDLGTFRFPVDTVPEPYYQLGQQTFFDEAGHGYFNLPGGTTWLDGWVSLYGALNGGTYFDTDLFGHDTDSAGISWNLTQEPHGFFMTMIMVSGSSPDHLWVHFYSVPWNNLFVDGHETVSLPDNVTISSIAFYGSNRIPDSGSTLLLLVIAWAVLAPAGSLLFGHFWRKS
jgi:hypothetical protein